MKPPIFSYLAATSVEQALEALQAPDAKVIAGGQSLMPMLNFRLLRPSLLVDINRIPELDRIAETPSGGLLVGARVRHHALETSAIATRRFPMLVEAVAHIGHLAIRNRGTIGGSLCHADPAAEHLLMAVLLDATLTVRSAQGSRRVRTSELIAGALSTTLEADELVTSVEFPGLAPGTGWGFAETSRRSGDFALVAAAALIESAGDKVVDARIAVAGGANGPVRVSSAESGLRGRPFGPEALEAVVATVRASVEPNVDLHASAELRHRLLGNLVRRTCIAAWQRSLGGNP